MIASGVIKNTLIISMGFLSTNSNLPCKLNSQSRNSECHASAHVQYSSSTRLNSINRYSLEILKKNKQKLESFKELQSNWDGYDGLPFNNSVIEKVLNIISNLDYQPNIFPTSRGSIQIEKYIDDDNLVEIEISEDEIFAYQVIKSCEIEKTVSASEINTLISDLYA